MEVYRISKKNFAEVIGSNDFYRMFRMNNEWYIRFESMNSNRWHVFDRAISLRDAFEKINALRGELNPNAPIIILGSFNKCADSLPVLCIFSNGEIKQFKKGFYLATPEQSLTSSKGDINSIDDVEVCKILQTYKESYQAAAEKEVLAQKAAASVPISKDDEPLNDKLAVISNQISDISLLLGRLKDELEELRNQ